MAYCAKKTLQEELIKGLEEEVAEHQEIRPLPRQFLNLMPRPQTETQTAATKVLYRLRVTLCDLFA